MHQPEEARTTHAPRAARPREPAGNEPPRSVLYGPAIVQQGADPQAGSYQKPASSLEFFHGQAAPGSTPPAAEATEKQAAPPGRPLISTSGVALVLVVLGVAAGGWWMYKSGSLPLLSSGAPDRGVPDSAPVARPIAEDAGAPPEEKPRPPARRGRAKVALRVESTPPGARISFCGRPTGRRTPATIRVRAGKACPLSLSLAGYHEHEERVTPRRGTGPLHVELERQATTHEKLQGTLRVSSIQVGTVYINGKPRGTTPLMILSLPSGTYSVSVHFKSLDLRTAARRVTISPGRTKAVHFDPSP